MGVDFPGLAIFAIFADNRLETPVLTEPGFYFEPDIRIRGAGSVGADGLGCRSPLPEERRLAVNP